VCSIGRKSVGDFEFLRERFKEVVEREFVFAEIDVSLCQEIWIELNV